MPRLSFSRNMIALLLLVAIVTNVHAQGQSGEHNIEQNMARKVVLSIEPYGLLLRSFKAEQDQVSVLLEKGFGGHSFHLKPGHLKQLSDADLLIWGGPKLEPYLVDTAKKAKRQLILEELPALDFIHGRKHMHDSSGHESRYDIDPHIWLSQQNSLELAQAMAKSLDYPEAIVESLVAELTKPTETAIQNKSLVVFHDAYAYLEKDLKLKKAFVFSDAHEKKAGLKQWQAFQNLLKQHTQNQKGICLVGPLGFEQTTQAEKIKTLLKKNNLQSQVSWLELDPLAYNKHYSSYVSFLRESQQALIACVN